MAKIQAIVDDLGHILAAQFDGGKAQDDEVTPSSELLLLPGQRRVEFEAPDEIRDLSGPDLTRYFAHVEVSWPAQVTPQPVEIVHRKH